MNQKFLPNGWKTGKLRDETLARTVSGGTPNRSILEYFNGNIPWVKSGELNDNYILDTDEKITEMGLEKSSAKIFAKGTLLIAMYVATAGKTGILALDAATNQAVCAIFPLNDSFDSNFLQYYLIQIRDEILSSRSGGAQPNISQRVIGSLDVILPPFPEQRAIARALRAVQGVREARLREIALERERKAALMEHLFTHGTRGEATKITEIGEMPESWKITKLGNVANVRGGFAFKSEDYSKDGIPLLKISNVSFGKIIWEDISFLPEEYKKAYKQFTLKPNDFVMAITRPVVAQGIKVSILSEKDTPCLLNQRVCQFIGGSSINLTYLFYVIHTKHFIDSIINGASGSQQPNISTTKVESITIGLPTFKEQNDIASILVACDSKIAALENEARLHDELFRAMLEELMSGRLPAGALVEAANS